LGVNPGLAAHRLAAATGAGFLAGSVPGVVSVSAGVRVHGVLPEREGQVPVVLLTSTTA